MEETLKTNKEGRKVAIQGGGGRGWLVRFHVKMTTTAFMLFLFAVTAFKIKTKQVGGYQVFPVIWM
jgi:hypothetical protein